MLPGDRFARAELAGIDAQQTRQTKGRQIVTDPPSDVHCHAQLLGAFPLQRSRFRLAGLDLAAGQLPLPGQLGRIAALGREHETAADDRRRHDYQHPGRMLSVPRPTRLSAEAVTSGLANLPLWSGDGDYIERIVAAPDFLTGIEIVRRVAALAEDMNHHPDIDVRWRRVRFGLTTHDAGGVTELDLALARRIDGVATELKAG